MSNKLRESTRTLVNASLDVINGLADFWPLTLRQIYYQLVALLVLGNRLGEYKRLSRVLSDARIAGLVPWEAMEDRSRSTLESGGWSDVRSFVQEEVGRFCYGYRRDLMQGQEHRLEIWVEKDALASIVHRIAFEYCVRVVVARGFSSTSYVKQCADRINESLLSAKQSTRVLYFGDFDPSGWEMPEAMRRKLVDRMDVCPLSLVIERCALLPEHIREHELPEDPDAMKEGDSRTAKFLELFGAGVSPVELDAIHPGTLQEIVRDAITRNLDMAEFARQQDVEESERQKSELIAGQVREFVSGQLSRETD
jgi:hypothetical protein